MEDNDAARIRELGAVLREFDLDAIRVKLGEVEYELIRREAQAAALPAYAAYPPPVPPMDVAAPEPAATPAGPSSNTKRVTAPVVGVFYRAASPGAEPFVSVGDRVTMGQTLCILEAMKLMNEITSDYAGVVTRIIPENAELVSLGQDLFWIE
jgi:acetyl-CoA carboxylase biotin carboxyl carrier protein